MSQHEPQAAHSAFFRCSLAPGLPSFQSLAPQSPLPQNSLGPHTPSSSQPHRGTHPCAVTHRHSVRAHTHTHAHTYRHSAHACTYTHRHAARTHAHIHAHTHRHAACTHTYTGTLRTYARTHTHRHIAHTHTQALCACTQASKAQERRTRSRATGGRPCPAAGEH